jgi:hypothetical protein
METMTHHRLAEIAVEKRSPFMPHRGLAASGLFLDTMLDQRTGQTSPIDCTESLGNIYRNRFQTCSPKDKTYRDSQLGEFIHSVVVEHAPEHEVICGSKPIGEKRGEGETPAGWQPPRALGCNIIAEMMAWSSGNLNIKSKKTLPGAPNVKVVYDTSPETTTRVARKGSLIRGTKALDAQAG